MLNKTKYVLMITTVVFQLGAVIAIFYNTSLAVMFAIIYVISITTLIGIFIYDRRLEKKEEMNYDDFDY